MTTNPTTHPLVEAIFQEQNHLILDVNPKISIHVYQSICFCGIYGMVYGYKGHVFSLYMHITLKTPQILVKPTDMHPSWGPGVSME